jgi:hypothetical protein
LRAGPGLCWSELLLAGSGTRAGAGWFWPREMRPREMREMRPREMREMRSQAGGGWRRPTSGGEGQRRAADAGVGRWCWGEIRSETELLRERARCWGRTEGSGARPLRERGAGWRRGVDFG